MKSPQHTPAELEKAVPQKQRAKQPYATELDDRALEHAQREKRPVAPPEAASRNSKGARGET